MVNSVAVNIGVHVSFELGFLSFPDMYLGVGLLDRMAGLYRTSILFSTVAVCIYIPTNSVEFPILYTLSSIYL